MKKIFTILGFGLVAVLNSFATVRTVNNNGLGGAQFSDIQPAINASSNGDTIYISGSASNYSDITINKRLTLIGPGTNIGGNTQNTQGVYIQNVYIDSTAINQSSTNIKIMGLQFNVLQITHGRNVTVERCQFNQIYTQSTDCNGLFVRGCSGERIWQNYINPNNSIEISNTVVKFIYGLTPNTIVNHCIILGQGYSCNGCGQQNNGTVYTNNIFYNTNFNNHSHSGAVFTNNLVYNYTVTSFTLPLAGSTGSNNQNAVDPLFVNNTYPQASNGNWYDMFSYNWHLQTTSPGHNAASDGTDIGIYGGTLSINQIGLVPTIPQVNEINIGNAAVPQNGTLNLNFKARKEN